MTENPWIRGFSLENLQAAFGRTFVGNYAPVQMISYMFDYELWGVSPQGFLFTNLLLHTTAGILLLRLVKRLGASDVGALAAALLFLVHPVQVESVAWVSQRKTLLCVVFLLASIHVWRTWRQRGGRGRYWLSVAFFVLSLLSKSLAVILPFVLMLHDRLLLGMRDRRSLLRPLIPFLAAGFLVGLLALLTQEGYEGGGRTFWHGSSAWGNFWTMPPVFVRYAGLLLWPTGLSAFYDQPERTGPDWISVGALVLIGAVVLLVVRGWRRHPPIGFWGGTAFLGLLPVSQIVPLVTLMNDRYLYLPLTGIAALFGLAVERGARAINVVVRCLSLCIVTGMIVMFAALAHQRVSVWRDSLALWQDAAAKEPNSTIPWLGMADLHYNAGRYDEAWKYYRHLHTMEVDRNGRDARVGDLMLALAEKEVQEGNLQAAEKTAREALVIVDDGDLRPLRLLAAIRRKKGDAAAEKGMLELARRLEEAGGLGNRGF
ncbi:MAG TPA: glycosyltransferase family 39 protein [Geobacteraceae bacterium]